MTAAISIGGTLAYLTDTDEDVNVMTVGQVKIDQLEYERVDVETNGDDAKVQEFHDNKPLYPAVTKDDFKWDTTDGVVDWAQIGKEDYTSGIWNPEKTNNEVDKMVFVKNKGDFDAYVRTVFAFEAGDYQTLDEFNAKVHLNLNETDWTWEWTQPPVTIGKGTYFVATATYNKVLEPGKLTEISLSQIALDPSATNDDVAGFGDTYQVLVQSQAVQVAGFEDADAALTSAFGELITDEVGDGNPPFELIPDDVPFEGDSPVSGTDVKTAIHYLEGDATKEKITAKVTSVTFGLNKDYSDIVDDYEGTLVDVEQDVPVYAYYVPNGSNYDIYFLASDDIFAPMDSYELFYNGQAMSALAKLDMSNLNTSRTTRMSRMFRNLPVTTLDVSGFDTGAATAMDYIFYQCSKLKSLNLSGWDVSNVEKIDRGFYQCSALTTVGDLENWDLSNVLNTQHMFYQCKALKELTGTQNWGLENTTNIMSMFHTCSSLTNIEGAEAWKLGKVSDASYAFYMASKLSELDVSDWDMSNATTTFAMFYGAASLETLDVSDWDMGNVKDISGMFSDCAKINGLDVSNWDTGNVTSMYMVFCRCPNLTSVDCGDWDTSKVTTMRLMFDGCTGLISVDASGWNTAKVTQMHGMFQNCLKLESVDVSSWDTSNVTTMNHMFRACISLEELDVSNWNVSKVTDFNSMFCGAGDNAFDMKLKELDVSNWQPTSAVKMNHMFYGCAQVTEFDMSGWNMPNLYTTSHMFADCSGLQNLDLSGWQTTSKWYSMDAMFNDCRSIKFLDVSSFTTSGVVEFSQIFEACWSLEEIKGLENWDTANGKTFDQTFLSCGSLKELNLSSFDTRNAKSGNKALNGDISQGFVQMFSGCNSLQKLILGANFDFDGNGTVTAVCALPNPGEIDGAATKWYNAANDTYYAASEIPEPEDVAMTYVAAVSPAQSES